MNPHVDSSRLRLAAAPGSPPPPGRCGFAPGRRRRRDNARVPTKRKRLFVLRHAKSSWDEPGLDDHERPLSPRGRRAVEVIAEHMREQAIAPELVLCSTARRTRETLQALAPSGEMLMEPELYGASCSTIIERLQRVAAPTTSVMVIGHNPALQMLVLRLVKPTHHTGRAAVADRRPEPDLDQIQRKFPTAALASLSFEGPWRALAPGCARLDAYVRPKQLY